MTCPDCECDRRPYQDCPVHGEPEAASGKRSVVLRVSDDIAPDDPIRRRDGHRLQVDSWVQLVDLPMQWFATRTDRMEDGDEVWEVHRKAHPMTRAGLVTPACRGGSHAFCLRVDECGCTCHRSAQQELTAPTCNPPAGPDNGRGTA